MVRFQGLFFFFIPPARPEWLRMWVQGPVEHEAALQAMLKSSTGGLERQAESLTDSLRAADTVMHVTATRTAGSECGAPADTAPVVLSAAASGACNKEGPAHVELTDALEEFLENCSSVAYERQQLTRYSERLQGLERVARQAEEMLKDLQCGTGVTLPQALL